MLQDLKGLGVRLMLDDFGTGYSSLNHVKRFPIEAIKVDREFTTGVAEDEGDRHILRAIVSMASAMDVAVIAEGVETREQARWLRHLGIKLVQGYAFGRPAPADTIEALLRDGLPLEHLALAFEPIDDVADAAPAEARGLPAPAAAPGGATVTLGEAAVACGVSASTVRRWADTGRIAVVRTSGGHRRFPVAELRRLNGEAAARPTVRPVALPADALPALSDLLASTAGELSAAVTRGLYDGSAQGWFDSRPGPPSSSATGARRSAPPPAAPTTTRRSTPPAGSSRRPTSRAPRCSSATPSSSATARPSCARCRSAAPRAPSSSAPAALFARLRQVTLEAADAPR